MTSPKSEGVVPQRALASIGLALLAYGAGFLHGSRPGVQESDSMLPGLTVPPGLGLPRETESDREPSTTELVPPAPSSRLAVHEPEPLAEMDRTAEYYLVTGNPEGAFRRLLNDPSENTELHARLGAELEERGELRAAFEVYEHALQQDLWNEEWAHAMSRLDPERALRSLESHFVDYPMEEGETLAEIHEGYAYCLHVVGRHEEVARALGNPADSVTRPSGCQGGYIRGEDWQWESWIQAEPEKVIKALGAFFTPMHHSQAEVALDKIVRAEVRRNRPDEARSWIEHYERNPLHNVALAARLRSELGETDAWEVVESRARQAPGDAELILPLARELERSGRVAEAAQARLGLLEKTGLADEEFTNEIREQFETYQPLLERYRDDLLSRGVENRLDELLGNLAEVYREQGELEQARVLFERARFLDPDDSEWWEALRSLPR